MRFTLLAALFLFAFQGLVYSQDILPGDLIITEFMANPDNVGDSQGEYVEIYNKTSFSINIDGFVLKDDGSDSHTISNGGTLTVASESFVVLAIAADPAGDGSVTPDYIYSGFFLVNTTDEIVLTRSDGTEVARLNYTDGDPGGAGVAQELNNIQNVDDSGQVTEGNFTDATASLGSGDKGSPGTAGNTTVTGDPKIRFSVVSQTAAEGAGSINLEARFEDPDGNSVDVDVQFLSGASTAGSADFSSTSDVTLTFGSSSADGATQTAVFTLTDDSDYEGSEIARFRLTNLSTSGTATIDAAADTLTLTITDNETPGIVINEFLADPATGTAGDANGDGVRDFDDDEFVEIYNTESLAIDISNWTLSDDGGTNTTHTFPEKTIIPANGAIVVFGGGTPTGTFGGSQVQTTSSLSLANTSGQVDLIDDNSTVIDTHTYGSEAGNDESLVRSPDGSGGFTGHTSADNADSSPFSPGTLIEGGVFSAPSVSVSGTAGANDWHLVGNPSDSNPSNLFSSVWTQGATGADISSGTANIYTYNESGGSYNPVSDLTATVSVGTGFAAFLYADDDYSDGGSTIDGNWPKTLSVSGTPNAGVQNISVSNTDADESTTTTNNEGWNLIANPFNTAIEVDSVIANLQALDASANANVYLWDKTANSGSGSFVSLADGSNQELAPFQAFFVRVMTSGVSGFVTIDDDDRSAETPSLRKVNRNRAPELRFTVKGDESQHAHESFIRFTENGTPELDPTDVFELRPLSPDYLQFVSVSDGQRLRINHLPLEISQTVEIPMVLEGSETEAVTLRWQIDEGIENPIFLHDGYTGTRIDLRNQDEYSFEYTAAKQKRSGNSPIVSASATEAESRFTLIIEEGKLTDRDPLDEDRNDLPNRLQLDQNYPNPFNPSTVIGYSVPERAEVTLQVFDTIGRKVATLVEGSRSAGVYSVTFDASRLASGVYIYRLSNGQSVITKKMVLIK